jgi:hypothetical protein
MTDDLDETELFSETPEQAASRILRDAAPFAAASIASIAADEGASPTVRLNAAKYIIDRNLGPIGVGTGDVDPLEEFLNQLNEDANRGYKR